MNISVVSNEGDPVRLRVSGEMNQDAVAELNDSFADILGGNPYARTVLLDLGDVNYIDSSGVGWLLAAHKKFREGGGKLVPHSPTRMAKNVFRVLNMQHIFPIHDSEQTALARVQEDSP